jgi:hypothetical protein
VSDLEYGLDPRDVNCPDCSAGVGKWCRRWRVPVRTHPNRSLAGRLYAIGYYEGASSLYGMKPWREVRADAIVETHRWVRDLPGPMKWKVPASHCYCGDDSAGHYVPTADIESLERYTALREELGES